MDDRRTMVVRSDVALSMPEVAARTTARDPEAIAIATDDRAVTFADLVEGARRVAAALVHQRDRRSEPIGLAIADPVWMLTAAFGVMAAGKAYVPMNPYFPGGRIRAVLDDLGDPLVLADGVGEGAFAAAGLRSPVRVESVAEAGHQLPPLEAVDPEQRAYILYTSGSTGRPKGIGQRHRQVVHNVYRHQALGIGPGDRVTLLSSDGFVSAVSNPFTALLNGACVLPFSYRHRGIHDILQWTERAAVTVFYGFPSFLRQMAAATPGGLDNRRVRLVYLGGEPVFPQDLASARRLFPAATIAVGLNSTETGLTCLKTIDPGEPLPTDVVPVGFAVPEVDLIVTDIDGNPVSPGTTGEIVVRSAYIRPEFWNVAAPADGTPPADAPFRTADRGYISSSGELVHLGRLDSVVKVRGHRVELSDVEFNLRDLPGIADAVVLADAVEPGRTELVAYVVASSERNEPALRRLLAAKLPEPMIPSAFVFLDVFPRTSTGKIDRRALAAMERPAPPAPVTPEAAGADDGTTAAVSAIWSQVLNLRNIAPSDNFFELGGHSLSALHVISLMRDHFGVPVPLSAIFETPTIARLASHVSAMCADAAANTPR